MDNRPWTRCRAAMTTTQQCWWGLLLEAPDRECVHVICHQNRCLSCLSRSCTSQRLVTTVWHISPRDFASRATSHVQNFCLLIIISKFVGFFFWFFVICSNGNWVLNFQTMIDGWHMLRKAPPCLLCLKTPSCSVWTWPWNYNSSHFVLCSVHSCGPKCPFVILVFKQDGLKNFKNILKRWIDWFKKKFPNINCVESVHWFSLFSGVTSLYQQLWSQLLIRQITFCLYLLGLEL